MGKGCACCTVRGDLLTKIRRIATNADADHVLIQAPAHADLVTLAKTFTVADDRGEALSSVAHLETLALVVDGTTLASDLHASGGRRLAERIELADAIVVRGGNDISLLTLRALNPRARIHAGADDLTLDSLRADEPFDLPTAQRRAALSDILDRTDPIRIEGVTRFAFRARRPFHPERFNRLLKTEWSNVLRARGVFWVAPRPDSVATLDTVAGHSTTSVAEPWWAAVPPERRPKAEAFKRHLKAIWHPAFGDRMQELALVGLGVDEDRLRADLEACLVTEAELEDPESWSAWPVPYPLLQESR
jgi:G3E family GTPase